MKKSVLLHICCAPCSTVPLKRLEEQFHVSLFFYNPNIYPEVEYEKRKNEALQYYTKKKKRKIFTGPFEPQEFYRISEGLEDEAEKGRRCLACFKLRLKKTAALAQKEHCSAFTTSLSISPHKSFDQISAAGHEAAVLYGLEFLDFNFKKAEGFKESTEISRSEGFYRQDYCGCEYSIRSNKNDQGNT